MAKENKKGGQKDGMDEYAGHLEKKEKAKKSLKAYNSFDDMMKWEDGSLDENGTKKLFQHLVNTGQAFHLQGMYGRAAHDMLDSGFIKPPSHGGKGQKDYYGNSMENYFNKFKK